MTDDFQSMKKQAINLHRTGDLKSAQEIYAQYLAARPQDAGMLSNLGVLQRSLGRHDKALLLQNRAASINPDDIGIKTNRANILSDLGQYDASIALRQEMLTDDPDHLDHLAMVGRCLRGKGDYAAAISHLRAALQRHPTDPEIRMQLAFALLGQGDYAEAFDVYRARWQAGELAQRDLNFPEWSGQSLAEKTIVVLPEQGFGDAVLFMRFLPALKATGAHVKVCAEGPVLPLFHDLEGVDELTNLNSDNVQGDYWINMMDLALLHFQGSSYIPPPARLSIPDDAHERAKDLTRPFVDDFKVGVVWSGSETYKANAFRSFHHSEFLPLASIDGLRLFSLYKGSGLDEFRADGTSALIIDAAGSDRNFGDCAATMMQMDLIITSDTATAHIAGSLGLPTWVLLHWDPFWVWRHSGETTPWYPTVKLFRQEFPLDWSGVIGRVRDELLVKMVALNE